MPLVIAHRGDVESAPENTLPAFEKAILAGADGIELDVYHTHDGHLVVHHDHYLGRTNNGSGFIGDWNFAGLRGLDAGAWFGDRFNGTTIPTLREVLELGRGKTQFQIEVKGTTIGFLNQVLHEISSFGVEDQVWVTSAHVPLLFHVKRLNSSVSVGVFFNDPMPDWMELDLRERQIVDVMVLVGGEHAHLPNWLISGRFVDRLHERGFKVHGINLNAEKDIRSALDVGVDKLDTDRLQLALSLRGAARKARAKPG